MQTIKIRTSQNIEIDYEVASLGDRILGRIVDMGVLLGIFYVFYIILIITFLGSGGLYKGLSSMGKGIQVTLIVIAVIYFIAYLFYDLVCEVFFNGQSIGKYAIKMKVVSLNGSRPTLGQFVIRWVFRLLDFGITFSICAIIAVAVSKKKQRIGDLMAGTTVIKTIPVATLNELYFSAPEDDYEPIFNQVNNLSDNDISLIIEVINNFKETGNNVVVFDMAQKVKQHLSIENPKGMNDFILLQTVVKDYTYLTSRGAV